MKCPHCNKDMTWEAYQYNGTTSIPGGYYRCLHCGTTIHESYTISTTTPYQTYYP